MPIKNRNWRSSRKDGLVYWVLVIVRLEIRKWNLTCLMKMS